MRGLELSWFKDYLSGRKQRVVMGGTSSEWSLITRGVPQGSILGPLLLFLLFVNDLPNVVEECSVNLYADDTAIYSADFDIFCIESLKDIKSVAEWIAANGLILNVSKTQMMVLSKRGKKVAAKSVRVQVAGEELRKQDHIRYLGVDIDQDLSWKVHTNRIRHQCLAKLAVIKRSSAYLPCHIRKLLYRSFVLPHLDYCSVVWNSCGATLSGQIDRIQNYALRMILRKPPLTPSIELRRILGWCSLHGDEKAGGNALSSTPLPQ